MVLGWTINTTLVFAFRLKIYSPPGINKFDTLKFANPGNDVINKTLMFILDWVLWEFVPEVQPTDDTWFPSYNEDNY